MPQPQGESATQTSKDESNAQNSAAIVTSEKEEGQGKTTSNVITSTTSDVKTSNTSTVSITVSSSVISTSSTTVSVTTKGGTTVHSTQSSGATTGPPSSAIKNPALAAVVQALRSASMEKGSTPKVVIQDLISLYIV